MSQRAKKRTRSVYLEITLLVLGVVALAILSLSLLTVMSISRSHEQMQAEKVSQLAGVIGTMPEISTALGKGDSDRIIAARAAEIGGQIGAWVIVMDKNAIRFSHTNPDLIGLAFTGGDEGPALRGESYVSRAVGISGPSLRGFAPIRGMDGQVIGAVCVGVLDNGITEGLEKTKQPLYLATLLSVSIGVLGSFFISRRIKDSIFGYEPHEIATRFQQLDAVLRSITAGIIAVDRDGDITMINHTAREMLDIASDREVIGSPILQVLPTSRLMQVMETGQNEYDQEQDFLNGTKVITTRVPIRYRGSIAGAMAIFRPKTEITKLAEELTGVKKYVTALRAQAHEFANKLQTISGLIELGDYDSSVTYINRIAGTQKNLVSLLVQNIKEPFVGGLLIGKISEAAERNCPVHVDPDSFLSGLGPEIEEHLLITIIGNLLDNAIEAVLLVPAELRSIVVRIVETDDAIHISIRDNGAGIAPAMVNQIFEPGFSTKGEQRGYGMANVKSCVERLKGTIDIVSEPGRGTEVTVSIPVKEA